MAMTSVITLRSLLPNVFRGMEASPAIRDSRIWEEAEVHFERGCRLCIQAESGSGKSSLLSFIYGNRSDYKGNILFDKEDIRTFSVERWCEVRTRSVALLPQEMRLFPELSVWRNIELKNQRTAHKTHSEIAALLERFGLADKRDVCVGQLSIGQQQRVALIRAVCQPFDFLFLDEPVSHLDERNNRIAATIVQEEAARQGAGIIATSVGQRLLLDDATTIAL